MKLPLQFTCRNVTHSDELEQEVGRRVEELESFSGDIIGCRVMLERPHLRHENGNQCHVRIELTIPGETIVVSHQPSLHGALRDFDEAEHTKEAGVDAGHVRARAAIHAAFDKARRRLQDAVRRQRGAVKTHEERATAARRQATSRAERQFVEAAIVRGQAVESGRPLPPGATHEIVESGERRQPVLKRKRFSTC